MESELEPILDQGLEAANDDWRSENDQLGRFNEECCVASDSFSGKARPLYECYRQWAEGAVSLISML
jgi:phage/plasmid-associated DNA primase